MNLITGATGLLGAHVLHHLLAQGKPVRAIYRSDSAKERCRILLAHLSDSPDGLMQQVDWVRGDILDLPSLEDAMQGVADVYHCAATISFDPKEQDWMDKVNVEGTANVVNLCLGSEKVRLCHVSSVAALGKTESAEVVTEEAEWKRSPLNTAYGISKRRAELEVWRGIAEGLEAVIVNPCIIIGPGNWDMGSAAMFTKVWGGLSFYTQGGSAFVDARDVAEAMVRLMDGGVMGQRFIVAAENLPFRHVFDRIADGLGKPRAKRQAGPLLSAIAWRVEHLRSLLTGRRPFITRETATTSQHTVRYDNGRLLAALPGFSYRSVDESIAHTSRRFLAEHR